MGTQISLGDPYSKNQMLINPAYAKQTYEHEAKNQVERLRVELNKTNSSMMVIETDQEFINEVFKFFRLRQRRK